jgi:hypothetical protein
VAAVHKMNSGPTPFGWVIRILASLFLLGYLSFGFLAAFILGGFPGESVLGNSVFVLLALVFLVGLYFLWSNREGLAGILFILWYAALWPCQIFIASENFKDLPAPGIFMFFVGVLSIIYWYNKRNQKEKTID